MVIRRFRIKYGIPVPAPDGEWMLANEALTAMDELRESIDKARENAPNDYKIALSEQNGHLLKVEMKHEEMKEGLREAIEKMETLLEEMRYIL